METIIEHKIKEDGTAQYRTASKPYISSEEEIYCSAFILYLPFLITFIPSYCLMFSSNVISFQPDEASLACLIV